MYILLIPKRVLIKGREKSGCPGIGSNLAELSTLTAAYTTTRYSVMQQFPFPQDEDDSKHRGIITALYYISEYYQNRALDIIDNTDDTEELDPEDIPISKREAIYSEAFQETLNQIDWLSPEFYSYRSNRIIMDSVVMRSIYDASAGVWLEDVLTNQQLQDFGYKTIIKTRRKIAAMKAVATMRHT